MASETTPERIPNKRMIAAVYEREDESFVCELVEGITPEEGATCIQVLTLKMGEADFDPDRFNRAIMALATGMGIDPDEATGDQSAA